MRRTPDADTAAVRLRRRLQALDRPARKALVAALPPDVLAVLAHDWYLQARDKQLPPPGDWFVWLLLAGRGFGKTRTGAHWIHERAMAGDERRRMILISKTPADARDDMIEGPGGILRNVAPAERPHYEPAKRRLVWPTGATARIRSGADPDGVRGFSGDTAWCDELAAWRYPRETWDNLLLGLREPWPEAPRVLVTTTPKPLALLREFLQRPGTVAVRGSTFENRRHLADRYFEDVVAPLVGTAKGRQEIDAELLDEAPGALWRRDLIEAGRRRTAGDLVRACVAVDPTVAGDEAARRGDNDLCGIVGCGVDGRDRPHGYVLADASLRAGPRAWGRRVVALYHRLGANFVVAEGNQGGALVREVLHAVDPAVPVRIVHARQGKAARAEPVVALYEQYRVHHVREHPPGAGDPVDLRALEDELTGWVPGQAASPNRLDALVWGFTALLVGRAPHPARVTTF